MFLLAASSPAVMTLGIFIRNNRQINVGVPVKDAEYLGKMFTAAQ